MRKTHHGSSIAILAGPASIILAHQKLTATVPQNTSNPFDVAATVQQAYSRCAEAPRAIRPSQCEDYIQTFDECAVSQDRVQSAFCLRGPAQVGFHTFRARSRNIAKAKLGPNWHCDLAHAQAILSHASSGARVMRRVSTGPAVSSYRHQYLREAKIYPKSSNQTSGASA